MQEGLPIAESLEDAMTDTIRCREKHQESYHLGTAALLWVGVCLCSYMRVCMSLMYFYRVSLGMGVYMFWVWVSVSLCSHMCVYLSLTYFHMVSLGVGVSTDVLVCVLSACMSHCVGGCHLCMGFLCGCLSLRYGVTQGVGVCHLCMGFLWVWVYVYICVSLRYGVPLGVGVCICL